MTGRFWVVSLFLFSRKFLGNFIHCFACFALDAQTFLQKPSNIRENVDEKTDKKALRAYYQEKDAWFMLAFFQKE